MDSISKETALFEEPTYLGCTKRILNRIVPISLRRPRPGDPAQSCQSLEPPLRLIVVRKLSLIEPESARVIVTTSIN